jgi:hypothetical protein
MVLHIDDIEHIETIHDNEWTPVIFNEFIDYLAINGNDKVNNKDYYGRTILLAMVDESTQQMVKVNRRTPKLNPLYSEYLDKIRSIIRLGGNPYIENDDGEDTYDILKRNRNLPMYLRIPQDIRDMVYNNIKIILDSNIIPVVSAAAAGGRNNKKYNYKTIKNKKIRSNKYSKNKGKKSLKNRNTVNNKGMRKRTK